MIRSAHLLCAIILTGACFACAPISTAPIPPAPPPPPLACDPQPFLSIAYMLPAGFEPDPNKNQTLPSSNTPVVDPYKTDLGKAYCLAAPPFQQQLLGLTAVYIDQSPCAACVTKSWGLRERYHQNQTYVALSSGLWTNGVVPNYSAFEDSVVIPALLGAASPITIQANPDTSTMTVLTALVHELGHVKWWQDKVEKKNSCANPPPGSPPYFADYSWPVHDNATPKFQYFGKQRHYNPHHPHNGGNQPRNGVDKDTLIADLGTPQLNQDLSTIYNGQWASIFATVTPDEDFIETYVLVALIPAMAQTQGTYLKVTLPDQSQRDLMSYFNNANLNLYSKAQWVQKCIM